MTALAQAIAHATGIKINVDSLSAVLIFGGIGVLVTLLATETYGLDLSYAFF